MRLRGKLNPGEHVIIATRQHYGALLPALAYLLVAIAASTFASTARSSPILWGYGSVYVVCRGVHHRLTYVPDPKRFEKEIKSARRDYYALRSRYI